jgi:hypothetical protein
MEHNAIKCKVRMLWQLMEKMSSSSPGHEVRWRDMVRQERDEEDDFGVGLMMRMMRSGVSA